MEAERLEQLINQKEEAEAEYREKGAEAGAEWCQTASYLELQYAQKLDPWDRWGHVEPQTLFRHNSLGDYFCTVISNDDVMRPEEDDDYLDDFAEKWLEGWLEGVEEYMKEFHQAQREAASGPSESTIGEPL